MILITIEEKIDEFINKNKRRKINKPMEFSKNKTLPIPQGYTKSMIEELSDAGFKISPLNLKQIELNGLELSNGGSTIKNLVKTLNNMTDVENIAQYEIMKQAQNPLIFGKLRWILLLFLLFSLTSILFAMLL
ncbi:MAG: hypothetical protein ACTSO9_19670 [Candidatus Helarchaeota archaeon]